MNSKLKIIGVGGFARSGKDTFVKVASKILESNGYFPKKLAFADALKRDLDPFLTEKYGISAWTDNTDEKKIIRPFMVAHGCGKREQTKGKYWVDKIDQQLRLLDEMVLSHQRSINDVFFISDCRFPNEVDWLHDEWNGWFVHLKKYVISDIHATGEYYLGQRIYDEAPNAEEAMNDPLCEKKADYKLELENVVERVYRETGNKITVDSLVDDSYLLKEVTKCLSNCPFLTIQNQQNPKSIWSSVQHLNTTNCLETR